MGFSFFPGKKSSTKTPPVVTYLDFGNIPGTSTNENGDYQIPWTPNQTYTEETAAEIRNQQPGAQVKTEATVAADKAKDPLPGYDGGPTPNVDASIQSSELSNTTPLARGDYNYGSGAFGGIRAFLEQNAGEGLKMVNKTRGQISSGLTRAGKLFDEGGKFAGTTGTPYGTEGLDWYGKGSDWDAKNDPTYMASLEKAASGKYEGPGTYTEWENGVPVMKSAKGALGSVKDMYGKLKRGTDTDWGDLAAGQADTGLGYTSGQRRFDAALGGRTQKYRLGGNAIGSRLSDFKDYVLKKPENIQKTVTGNIEYNQNAADLSRKKFQDIIDRINKAEKPVVTPPVVTPPVVTPPVVTPTDTGTGDTTTAPAPGYYPYDPERGPGTPYGTGVMDDGTTVGYDQNGQIDEEDLWGWKYGK